MTVYATVKQILSLIPNLCPHLPTVGHTFYCCPVGREPSDQTVRIGTRVKLHDSRDLFRREAQRWRDNFGFPVPGDQWVSSPAFDLLGKEVVVTSRNGPVGADDWFMISHSDILYSYLTLRLIECVLSGATAKIDFDTWDVSRVTDMERVFENATWFNTDLSWWDVSRVTNMQRMFYGASSFNQSLCGNAWVNSKAPKTQMFYGSPGSISKIACGECPSKLF